MKQKFFAFVFLLFVFALLGMALGSLKTEAKHWKQTHQK